MNVSATANPHPVLQGEFVVDRLAAVATPRTGEPPIYRHQSPVIPQGFVFQLTTEFAEGRIQDRSGQLGSRHPFHTQLFDANQVKLSNKVRRHLVDEITTLTGHLLVNLAQPSLSFLSPIGSLFSTGNHPLGASYAPVGFTGELWRWDRFPLGRGGKINQAHIHSDRILRGRQRHLGQFEFLNQADVPVAKRIALEAGRLGDAFYRARQPQVNPADLGQ